MPTIVLPSQRLDTVIIGSTTVSNPVLMLMVNGIGYANGYRITYVSGYRSIFPSYNSSNGDVLMHCLNIAYGEDLPALTLSNIEVSIIG